MASFVEKCNCRGMSVKGVLGAHHNLRPEITGRLLQERHIARYVVAPTGYGKSSVAYEYAQIVFGFMHTFWIKCTSPCFIRDLDDGTLAQQIARCDPQAALVVFDDVPHLDLERASAFDAVIDTLLDAGAETVATCTPSVDTFTSLRPDKMLLKARDLLLTDDELSVERMRGALSGSEGDVVSAADRAACMAWDAKGTQSLLKGLKREDLTADLRLVALLTLLFSEGPFSDLEDVFADSRVVEDADFLEDNYPFLGIDSASRSFGSISVGVPDIAKCLGLPMRELALSSGLGSASELCGRIADKLVERGHADRASAFMAAASDKPEGAEWLDKAGWSMVADLEPLAVERLFEPVRKHAEGVFERISAAGAWAALALQDADAVKSRCRSVARSSASEWQDLTACLLAQARLDGRFRVEDYGMELERIFQLRRIQEMCGAGNAPARHDAFDWDCALALARACCEGDEAFLSAWDACVRELDAPARGVVPGAAGPLSSGGVAPAARKRDEAHRATAGTLLVFGAWRVQGVLADGALRKGAGLAIGRFSGLASRLVLDEDAPSVPKWVRMTVGKTIVACADAMPADFGLVLSASVERDVMQMQAYLSEQVKELKRMRERTELAKEEYRITHPDPFRPTPPAASKRATVRSQTPTLKIEMFGGFDAHIEDDVRRPCTFKRKKAKLALAMLAINRGREMSRGRLTEMLWPGSADDFCRRNFYVIWGSLKRELTVEGSCPYLLRSQTGYRLDARFVSTDLDLFERLCRSLLFGGEDVVSWEDVFEQVTCNFSEDFLPDVSDNEFVSELRDRYKDQLIDGLISASSRLAMLGEARGSLWFAREALRRDELREDSYISLMRAQIASNQRGAALETYFTCRRMLTERLGIDPSQSVVELYNSIIETEEPF